MIVELALDHFIARIYDKLKFVVAQLSELVIHQRASFFQNAESADHFAWHHVIADVEMAQRALCLRAPVAIGGDLDRAHRIGFGSGFRFSSFGGWLCHEVFTCAPFYARLLRMSDGCEVLECADFVSTF
jgi:hypothetical protein